MLIYAILYNIYNYTWPAKLLPFKVDCIFFLYNLCKLLDSIFLFILLFIPKIDSHKNDYLFS